KPKDPNAPRRPASSYILFQNAVRTEMKATNPEMTNHELLAMISKKWQDMSTEDK
ncbi:high mobility group box domain-containing protein, partial [Infundibulicybe gibba]